MIKVVRKSGLNSLSIHNFREADVLYTNLTSDDSHFEEDNQEEVKQSGGEITPIMKK